MVQLRNGLELPLIGLGTFQSKGSDCTAACIVALRAGCRLIGTAVMYRLTRGIV